MKALRFAEFGEPSVLKVEEVALPVPREGEVLVRVAAAAINPSDAKNVAGAFKVTTLPRTPGRDFAGTVVGGGRHEGLEVWGSAPGSGSVRDGSHAEYVVVPEVAVAPKPLSLTMAQAAALGVPYLTAWAALVETAQIQAGETVLIVGAGGAVGRAATQIANWQGARVLGAMRGRDPLPGVLEVIDTQADHWFQRVRKLTAGSGVDAVGGALFEPALESLRVGGRQVAITSMGGPRVSFDLIRFYHNRSRLLGVDSNGFTPDEAGRMAAEITRGFEAGALTAPDVEMLPLERAAEAYRSVLGGRAAQKQIITP